MLSVPLRYTKHWKKWIQLMAVCFYLYHCYATISSSTEHIHATKHAKTPQYINITQALRYFQWKICLEVKFGECLLVGFAFLDHILSDDSDIQFWKAVLLKYLKCFLQILLRFDDIAKTDNMYIFIQSWFKIPTHQSYPLFQWKLYTSTRHEKRMEVCFVC